MKVLRVIPLSRAIEKETLSYFSGEDVSPGSLVTIPLRKKTVLALVTSAGDVAELKADIKNAAYSLKKIKSVRKGTYFLPAFLEACEKTGEYFAGTTGGVAGALIPQPILHELKEGRSKELASPTTQKKETDTKLIGEKYLLQEEEKERIAFYKSLVREEFAQGHSVFFCLPTVQDMERISPHLTRGIEEFSYIFHSHVSKKDIVASWKKALHEKHPVLIVGTGMYFSIPRTDIKTVVVERENAGGYKVPYRPFFDIRTFSEFFARALGAKLIWGDLMLRTETLWRREQGHFLERFPLKFRSLTNAEQKCVDMTKIYDHTGKEKFVLMSNTLKTHMREAREHDERTFLLSARRGLYPITLCSDCGKTVLCEKCNAPLVLHGKKETATATRSKNIFMCHWCGVRVESHDTCAHCGGWRLTSLGIGAERIEKELEKLFPGTTIFRLDKDTASTRKKALKIIEKFYASPKSILIGTEMAIPYLENKMETVAVVSIDALFTLADFRISERVFSLLLRLRSRASRNFIIQTRVPEFPLFTHLMKGNLLDFYREEITLREKFNYPPFSALIKVSTATTKQKLVEDVTLLKTLLEAYNPEIYPAFISKVKNSYLINVLMRVKHSSWPDSKLLSILYSLPPSFTIRVDPESIL